jgi:cell division protein FtsA
MINQKEQISVISERVRANPCVQHTGYSLYLEYFWSLYTVFDHNMKKRSLFKIFEDFSSKQLSKINSILDSKYEDDHASEDSQDYTPNHRSQDRGDKSARLVAALDVGSSKVTAIIGRLNPKDRIEILGVGYAVSDGLIRGSVSNIAKTSAAIRLALNEASEQANVPIPEVYSSYSGVISNHVEHGVLLRNDPSTEINIRDIEKLRLEMFNAILPPGEQLIYMQAKAYTIDDEPGIKDPVGMSGKRIEADFQLITASTTPIEYLQKCCAQANVTLKQIIPAPVASAEAVICEEEIEEGIAVVDIGAAVTSVAVYNKGNLIHAENFPLGGNNITADIRDFTGLQL